jgi:hypothetical protein
MIWLAIAISLATSVAAIVITLRGQEATKRMLAERDDLREARQEEYMPGVTAKQAPLPFDENDPPKLKYYTGPDGKHRCECHNEPINNGDTVMIWPRPDLAEGARSLFCHKFIKEQQ